MPKLTRKLPSYRRHSGTGQAVVTLSGDDVYLGKDDTPESREKYNRLIAEWLNHGRVLPSAEGFAPPSSDAPIVAEVLLAFFEHAHTY